VRNPVDAPNDATSPAPCGSGRWAARIFSVGKYSLNCDSKGFLTWRAVQVAGNLSPLPAFRLLRPSATSTSFLYYIGARLSGIESVASSAPKSIQRLLPRLRPEPLSQGSGFCVAHSIRLLYPVKSPIRLISLLYAEKPLRHWYTPRKVSSFVSRLSSPGISCIEPICFNAPLRRSKALFAHQPSKVDTTLSRHGCKQLSWIESGQRLDRKLQIKRPKGHLPSPEDDPGL